MNYKILTVATFTFLLVACGQKTTSNIPTERETLQDGVEVLYFHGKQRCVTCNTIEQLTREVLEENFADELDTKTIIFNIIDISQPENEKIADEYEVTWSSLFVSKWVNGVKITTNMTDFGFSYAKNQPEEFKKGLKEKLDGVLHN
ncbi:MAG TPA: nitrophenyl compound nitroreductase subunit ArsF family protein [Paludibacteraceae bacterium]|nr:nitrophenyl compound nitroreductase subunit ArsF family protein [Paludibacteraceae bacterium]